MGTAMKLIETWKESTEYEKALNLIETITAEDDSAIIHVKITVQSHDPEEPDHVKSETVSWTRRYEHVEEA